LTDAKLKGLARNCITHCFNRVKRCRTALNIVAQQLMYVAWM